MKERRNNMSMKFSLRGEWELPQHGSHGCKYTLHVVPLSLPSVSYSDTNFKRNPPGVNVWYKFCNYSQRSEFEGLKKFRDDVAPSDHMAPQHAGQSCNVGN